MQAHDPHDYHQSVTDYSTICDVDTGYQKHTCMRGTMSQAKVNRPHMAYIHARIKPLYIMYLQNWLCTLW